MLLNFAYFQQENYAESQETSRKILLVNWPKKRYWFSLAGAYTELGEDINLHGLIRRRAYAGNAGEGIGTGDHGAALHAA